MKAAVYKGNQKLSVEEVPTPTPGPGQVLIRVKYCAICGTDVHGFLYDVPPPGTVMGHEYCGTVTQVGHGVSAWSEGDRVVGEADVLLTTIDARLKFSLTGDRMWHRISPFIVAGGGVVFDVAGDSEADELLLPEDRFGFGTSFYGTTGLGLRWFVTDRFAVRADGTFSLWKVGTPPGFSDPVRNFPNVEEGEWLQSLGLTISTLIRW